MKMRRHRLFLLCTVGLCVVSFLHYYKALHYVSVLRELSAPYPNIKSFIMVSGLFWKARPFPLTSTQPSESFNMDVQRSMEVEELFGSLHQRIVKLQDDTASYFVRTKAGALCFREGTETAAPKEDQMVSSQRRMLQHQEQEPTFPGKAKRGKRLVKCVCRHGWHGPYCGVPTMVYHSSLPTKDRLTPREVPRRIINAININHEFDLLHVRFHELAQAVDLFLVCESNFTAYGEGRPLQFLHLLLNGTYDYVRHKILYIFLDHFPQGGRQDGWIADDYLRTFLTRNGMSRVRGLRPDDVFIINDADEIPAQEGILFLKLFDGWTEPFAFHMRKSLYGFFWKQLGSLEVLSGCTVRMLGAVYEGDGIKLRRRDYYTMPEFRKYENETGHILVQWSIGSPVHFAGWHCSWCFTPEGILHKLVSAQNGDFPRWGDFEDKRDLNYIRELIRTGGWFDGSVQEYPPSDAKEPMYAPKYLLENYDRYRYMLENPYAKKGALTERAGTDPQRETPWMASQDALLSARSAEAAAPHARGRE
ncbi:beta-1,4-mannosyl-glycoprotein 4-beta-N-acetylglucosaminyltransferase-like isoform X2 [Brienomyrus brachyistius]|nr:beta-1,4-mannosyl-glycoprotein 4-beta-N-acetylglucosaminyltransferase-like isoform X2 [Brienomyrus brachyistius]XP_048847377.1 beta-1,4-mannosyl-glycoprotein 4-beta-N-acetylglucosaminyltransferase-like isoform X2 [Brienomyrus brachyistius]XP_048847378.1 beta-1,4-mannosyl-glycoprotein 4-beta-N-acetylglucosaminyltransferase-like isoform X2 [Brienomyrus brachyistius]XP_048847379.1 beta-1,4-mannosyl-glycoprotein 4-beta-N-acetylglucosaminyltransferase-like isoform X2 [Brienomyrus brachyistius]